MLSVDLGTASHRENESLSRGKKTTADTRKIQQLSLMDKAETPILVKNPCCGIEVGRLSLRIERKKRLVAAIAVGIGRHASAISAVPLAAL